MLASSCRLRACLFLAQLPQPPTLDVKMSFLPNKHGIVVLNAGSFNIEKIVLSSITTRSRMALVFAGWCWGRANPDIATRQQVVHCVERIFESLHVLGDVLDKRLHFRARPKQHVDVI
jgi:hypothetical protein